MQNLDRFTPYALAALRIAAALIFIEHGIANFLGFFCLYFTHYLGKLSSVHITNNE